MPDILTPILAGAALIAVYALGYAALGALAALIDGHAPRASVRDLRRRAVTARARRVVAADRRIARAAAATRRIC